MPYYALLSLFFYKVVKIVLDLLRLAFSRIEVKFWRELFKLNGRCPLQLEIRGISTDIYSPVQRLVIPYNRTDFLTKSARCYDENFNWIPPAKWQYTAAAYFERTF
jgi:hypothetical protein